MNIKEQQKYGDTKDEVTCAQIKGGEGGYGCDNGRTKQAQKVCIWEDEKVAKGGQNFNFGLPVSQIMLCKFVSAVVGSMTMITRKQICYSKAE